MTRTWKYPSLSEVSSAICHYNQNYKVSSVRKGVLCYKLPNTTERIVIYVKDSREVTRMVLLISDDITPPASLISIPLEIAIVSKLNNVTPDRLVELLSGMYSWSNLILMTALNDGTHFTSLLSILPSSAYDTLRSSKPRYTVALDSKTGDWKWRALSGILPVPTTDPNRSIVLETFLINTGNRDKSGNIKVRFNKLLKFKSTEEKLEFLYNWRGESNTIKLKGDTSLEILGKWLPDELSPSQYNLINIPKELILEQLHKEDIIKWNERSTSRDYIY